MLKNQNIICISSIDWDFIWQGHQEIMSIFAENGNRVFFIENTGVRMPGIRDFSRIKHRISNWLKGVKGIRKEKDNLYIFSPLILPFPYARIARWINRFLILSILEKWMKVMDFEDPIIWSFLPTPLSSDIIGSFRKKFVIYYCIDNFSASSASAKKIKKSEVKLLKKADVVFVTSKELHNYCSQHNEKVHDFPFTVNFEKFEKIRLEDNSAPEELKGIKRPIVGYIGGIHKWIDQSLIKESAKKCPEYSFVFVGPVQTDIALLSKLKNVYFLGKKDHKKIPLFIKYFDVCTIPYLITDYTRNVYPTKLNEYLAMSKPVVSTNLPEVVTFNKKYKDVLYVAEPKESFDKCIRSAIDENNQDILRKRIETAKQNSWGSRIEEMSNLIDKETECKKLDKEAMWKENLLHFYRLTRKRFLLFIGVCIFIYFLLFKTSFVWFLAEPLRIDNPPQKVDAIVVFGAGVGETGNPGKSTIERARYAAELYKRGYADKIIFSSGYAYTYNDAENMRLFAISMDVPKRDIILEQKANNAYENVVFSKEILDKNDWHSVLVVSSPYNMRRVSMVFNKWCKEIEIFYTPVKKSQFYDRIDKIKVEQIKAIIHEYLGILYYWTKGYL